MQAAGVLLWEACRRRPDVEAIHRALADDPDPSVVVPAAIAHGMGPMLWRALGAAAAGGVMGFLGEQLDHEVRVRRLEAELLLPRAVAQAVAPLTDAGLEPIVLKGPSLAARYPEPWLRSMEDIDLFLPRRQHGAALRALRQAGWQVERAGAYDRYDVLLRHPDVPVLALELHYGLEAWYKAVTTIDAEALWSRRVQIDCMGTPAFGLPPEDELVTLAQHAGKPFHSFRRLIWIVDLGVVVGDLADRDKAVDWDAVGALARAVRWHHAGVERAQDGAPRRRRRARRTGGTSAAPLAGGHAGPAREPTVALVVQRRRGLRPALRTDRLTPAPSGPPGRLEACPLRGVAFDLGARHPRGDVLPLPAPLRQPEAAAGASDTVQAGLPKDCRCASGAPVGSQGRNTDSKRSAATSGENVASA